jgi:hypothetical protein
MVAWRERLVVNASHFVFLRVLRVVNNLVNPRVWYFLSRLKYISSFGHRVLQWREAITQLSTAQGTFPC